MEFDYIIKREILHEKINKALDDRNKNEFLKLSTKYNELLKLEAERISNIFSKVLVK